MKEEGNTGIYRIVKRVLDVVFSAILLSLLALPMTVVALLVGISSDGDIFFRQRRVGRGGKLFVCYKFRTMTSDAPPNRPSADFPDVDRYLTPVGRFLRCTSLDELPQLFNVLRGQMSLVGPRPLIGEEREIHRLRQDRGVYEVRPGMTGLSQVSGRTLLNDVQKAEMDERYVKSMSLATDLKILWRTLFALRVKE